MARPLQLRMLQILQVVLHELSHVDEEHLRPPKVDNYEVVVRDDGASNSRHVSAVGRQLRHFRLQSIQI